MGLVRHVFGQDIFAHDSFDDFLLFQQEVNHLEFIQIDLNKEWIVPPFDNLVFIPFVNAIIKDTLFDITTEMRV
jgi:hypothetical protein